MPGPPAALSAPAAAAEASCSWTKRGAAMLCLDAAGEPSAEVGLGRGESSGGASPSGRLAWILDRETLRVYGVRGKPLWSVSSAQAAEKSPPVVFSQDEETLLLSRKDRRGWWVLARTYLGNRLAEAGPLGRLESMTLTRNGRFAMARWRVLDRSATHTFLDLKTKRRTDLPSGGLLLGAAELAEDGKVLSGGKVVLDLAASPAEARP